MSATQPGCFNLQEFTDLGTFMSGGRLYTYTYGTTTLKVAYTDAAGLVAHTYTNDGIGGQYIALDARGELPAPLYLTAGSYDIALKTAAGATVWTRRADPAGDALSSALTSLASTVSVSDGDALVGVKKTTTGAVATTQHEVNERTIEAFDFMTAAEIADVKAGTLSLDVTTALQAFLTAAKNNRGHLPTGKYKITSTLTLDPTASHNIYGDGYDDNAVLCTSIYNAGTGKALSINAVGASTDNLCKLEDFAITGNALSTDGFFADTVPGLRIKRVLSVNNGAHGFNIVRCFNGSIEESHANHNLGHGMLLNRQNNSFSLKKNIANSNGGGFSGIALTGAAGAENLSIVLICNDTTANSYGMTIQYSQGVELFGNYAEGNTTANLYADSTAAMIDFRGNYQQDGSTQFSNPNGLIVACNVFAKVGAGATELNIIGPNNAARTGLLIQRNLYTGGATKTFSNGAKEPNINYGAAIPTTGTYEVGDGVINPTPAIGAVPSWQCSAAGTPGTWLAGGQTPGNVADWGDTSQTLTTGASAPTNFWASALTTNRTVTLSSTDAFTGAAFRVTRRSSATGASTLTVGGLKALAVGQWCDVEWNGASWQLTAFGSL